MTLESLSVLSRQNAKTAPEIQYIQKLSALYQAAIDHGLPVAMWQSPHQKGQFAVVDFNKKVQPMRIDFTRHQPGFAFSPFNNVGGNNTLFINAGLYINKNGIHILPAANEFPALRKEFFAHYNALTESLPNNFSWRIPAAYSVAVAASRSEFCTLVDDAITYIKESGIKKIVASRATEAPLPPGFNPVALFEVLCNRYSHAFVSLVSIPGIGTWIGASPELLLSLQPNALQTVALAGTQARPANKLPKAVRWGQKEIEEQALVSDYIRDFFHDIGLRTFTTTGPRTISAGNVVHLQTSFTVKDTPAHLHQLANQVLHRLHPTSAVCGMPKNEALSFILEKEKYNRAFYSGFLGPVHLENESRLYVNLRCLQLKTRSALLYVGAGITADSNPEAEWEETVLKSKTLLSVL